jgi:hypothetical protein
MGHEEESVFQLANQQFEAAIIPNDRRGDIAESILHGLASSRSTRRKTAIRRALTVLSDCARSEPGNEADLLMALVVLLNKFPVGENIDFLDGYIYRGLTSLDDRRWAIVEFATILAREVIRRKDYGTEHYNWALAGMERSMTDPRAVVRRAAAFASPFIEFTGLSMESDVISVVQRHLDWGRATFNRDTGGE